MNARLHLLAVGAVVIAVALGLGLGTASSRGVAAAQAETAAARDGTEAAQAETAAARAEVTRLAAEVQRLGDAATAGEAFTDRLISIALAERLRGVGVTVLALPGAAATVDPLAQLLTAAGATVAGRLTLTKMSTVDADRLAGALLDRWVSAAERRSVIAALVSTGQLTGGSSLTGYAGAVLLVGPASSPAALELVAALETAGPLLVAGSGGAPDSLVAAARADASLATAVSTVDDVTTVGGRFTAVWALADLVDDGIVGHHDAAALPPGVAAAASG